MKKLLTKEDMKPSIFGMFDGLTSLLGVLIPLLKYTHLLVFTTCMGLAVSSAISMGLGEYLSFGKDIPRKTKLHSSLYMGTFTGLGCFLPVVPFLFSGGRSALSFSILIYLLLTCLVAYMKKDDLGWKSSLVQTFSISVVAIVLVVCATLVLPVPTS